ncbi:MAG: Gfo/Idh/MocA family oxidoreductase [Lachnospiraceae bacterium]|nr:Gfo/Idh/MocA family oxidoreductase [Lachnospiraceae bacterium]
MNIIVIGLGSMGKRRVRLIKELYKEYIVTGIDSRKDRRMEVSDLYGIETFQTLGDMEKPVDCAFVCTSPLSHVNIIKECLTRGWHVFTELNLVDDGYDENILLAKEKGCHLFLSSTFFYREEIKYIRSRVTDNKKWNYIYHIGQYLKDWHPWENYKDFFVRDQKTNGCREIMAIELPWLTGTFGKVAHVHAHSDKMTGLQIGYDDNYMIQIVHENGNKGVLIVDVVSPAAVRKLEVYSEGNYLSWSGTPDSLLEFSTEDKQLKPVALTEKAEHKTGYREFIVENAYRNEIREFFDVVLNGKEPLYGFEQDKVILRLIDSMGA